MKSFHSISASLRVRILPVKKLVFRLEQFVDSTFTPLVTGYFNPLVIEQVIQQFIEIHPHLSGLWASEPTTMGIPFSTINSMISREG